MDDCFVADGKSLDKRRDTKDVSCFGPSFSIFFVMFLWPWKKKGIMDTTFGLAFPSSGNRTLPVPLIHSFFSGNSNDCLLTHLSPKAKKKTPENHKISHLILHLIHRTTLSTLPPRMGLSNTLTASLQRGKKPLQRVSIYDSKQSDCEVPALLELWGMWSTASIPSFSGPLLPGVKAPDTVLPICQTELNCVLMLNLTAWNGTLLYAKVKYLKWNYFWHWRFIYAKLNCVK